MQFGQGIRVSNDVDVEDICDGFPGQIILRRSDATTRNHDIGALKRDAQNLRHAVQVVANARLVVDVSAVFC